MILMSHLAVVFICVCVDRNIEILPQDPSACFRTRGFRFRGPQLDFHIASADPFRNGCFAEFAGFASAGAGRSLDKAICLGLVNGPEVEHAVGGHHSGACNPP